MLETACQVIANGLDYPEPSLAFGESIYDVRAASAARGAIECASAASVGIRAYEHGPGQRITVLRHNNVRDALIHAHVVEPFDAEFFYKLAADIVCLGTRAVGRRHAVVEHYDNSIGIFDAGKITPI